MSGEGSPAAQAANRRLYELRAQLAARRAATVPNDHRPSADEGAPAANVPSGNASHSLLVIAAQSVGSGAILAASHRDGRFCAVVMPPPEPMDIPPVATAARRADIGPLPEPAKGQGERANVGGASHSLSGNKGCSPKPDDVPSPAAADPRRGPYPLPTALPGQGESSGASPGQNSPPSITDLIDRIAALPPHLGWGSATLTAHLRKLRITNYELRMQTPADGDPPAHETTNTAACDPPPATRYPPLVKVYPAIALAMLRQERVAAGRVWLLLRHLDQAGRGWVELDAVRAALCGREAPLRLCGRRRLRQLLAEGEGVFWQREARAGGDRLWLRGPARVAAALGVSRLVGRPVGVPVAALLGGIGDARAQLYATFHAGRLREGWERGAGEQGSRGAGVKSISPAPLPPCAPASSPIARDTLADLSGVCPRSQAAYERRAGIVSRANIALGERVSALAPAGPAEQERAWQQGRALFRLRDHRGLYGRAGATYLAWRLPNAYGPARGHQPRPRGQQKRINRHLADLFTKGMTGNGAARIEKRFFGTAVAAVKARETAAVRYWPLGGGHGRLWGALEMVVAGR